MGHKATRERKSLAGGHHWDLLGPPECVGQRDDDRRIGVGLVEHLLEKYDRSGNCTLFVDFEGTAQEILGECHHQNCYARHVCT
jgi:hypothetical protein